MDFAGKCFVYLPTNSLTIAYELVDTSMAKSHEVRGQVLLVCRELFDTSGAKCRKGGQVSRSSWVGVSFTRPSAF